MRGTHESSLFGVVQLSISCMDNITNEKFSYDFGHPTLQRNNVNSGDSHGHHVAPRRTEQYVPVPG